LPNDPRRPSVKKTVLFALVALALLSLAAPSFAQEAGGAAGNGKSFLYMAAGFSMAFAAAICGLAQGKAIAAACEGVARNPGMADKIQLLMIIGVAFIESLALYVLLIIFVKM
jgi:F-type H+-transporting ATPase subunit c